MLGKKLKVLLSGFVAACMMLPSLPASAQAETLYVGNNSLISGDDVCSDSTIDIGFSFNFYGQEFTTVKLSSNGVLLFGDHSDGEFENTALPNPNYSNSVCAFWDDITTAQVVGESGDYEDSDFLPSIYTRTVGQAGHRMFIAQWTNMYYYGTVMQMGTFQAILYEDTQTVQVQYRTLIDSQGDHKRCYGGSATIGIEKDSTTAVQFSYGQMEDAANPEDPNSHPTLIAEKQAISFTPNGDFSDYTMNPSADYEWVYLTDASAPAVPSLANAAPSNGATDVSTSPLLQWDEVDRANSYRVLVSTDSAFSAGTYVVNTTTTENSYQLTDLAYDKTYYWRIEAVNASGSNMSDSARFTTVAESTYPLTITVKSGTAPIAGASVTIGDLTVTTDASGNAVFPPVTAGSYSYTVTAPNYQSAAGSVAVSGSGGGVSVSLSYADTDADGIPDIRDKYPNDPTKSYDEPDATPDQAPRYHEVPVASDGSEAGPEQQSTIASGDLHAYQMGDAAQIGFQGATVTIPVEILDSKIGTDLTSQIIVKLQESDPQANPQAGQILLANHQSDSVKVFDLSMIKLFSNGSAQQIHQLGGLIKITIPLDSSVTDPSSFAIYFYNSETQTMEDMHATYDAATHSMVFYTPHFSEFILAKGVSAAPGTGDRGVYYWVCLAVVGAAAAVVMLVCRKKKKS